MENWLSKLLSFGSSISAKGVCPPVAVALLTGSPVVDCAQCGAPNNSNFACVQCGFESRSSNVPRKNATEGFVAAAWPAWSPDSRRLAFSAMTGSGREKVFVVAVENWSPTLISEEDRNSDLAPVWLDGQTLAHITKEPTKVFNVAWLRIGGARSLVTEEGGVRGRPSYHAGSGLLIFERTYGKDLTTQEICSIEIRTGEYVKITTNDEEDFGPALSPDGKKIAFSRRIIDSNGQANYDVWLMNLDGTGEQRLTSDPGSDQYPSWSPDGKEIAFESTRSGSRCIYVMKADGSGVRRITQGPEDRLPAWAPNGKLLAYCAGVPTSSQIYVIPMKRHER